MTATYSHVALIVPDIQEAESYYMNLFDVQLLFREMVGEDGLWHTLRPETGYAEAAAAGISISMLSLC